MRIHEIFNVTDGRDRNVGVDFLLLFSHFYLKTLDSSYIYFQLQRVINILPYQTPGISNKAPIFMRDVKMFASRTDTLVQSAIFYNIPAGKWFDPIIVVP